MALGPKEPAMNCPGCRHPMAPESREPILFTDCLVDVTYVCEWCGIETKRAVRAPGGWLKQGRTHRDRRINATR